MRIRYYKEPTDLLPEIIDNICLVNWMFSKWSLENTPKDLRVFKGGLSEQTDITEDAVKNPSILLEDTEYTVTHMAAGPAVPYIVAVVVSIVIAIALAPSVSIPDSLNRSQQSPTNSLGDRQNKPRINERLPDVRGKVKGHVPDLLAAPYTKFIDNSEFEYLYLAISSQLVDVEDIKDGDTLLSDITDARAAVYGPNTSPNSGVPISTIGDPITDKVLDVSQAPGVTGQILTPENSLSALGWFVVNGDPDPSSRHSRFTVEKINATQGRLKTSDADTDFTQIISDTEELTLRDCWSFVQAGVIPDPGFILPDEPYFTQYDLNDIYGVVSVAEKEIILDLTSVDVGIQASWTALTGETDVQQQAWQRDSAPAQWFIDEPPAFVGTVTYFTFSPEVFNQSVVLELLIPAPDDIDHFWLNFTAEDGLYKATGSASYEASVEVTITEFELNVSDVRTGASTVTLDTLVSNPRNRRESVRQTKEITAAYSKFEIEVRRSSDTDIEFSGTVVDSVKLRDVYFAIDVPNPDFGDLTSLHTVIQGVDAALRVKERLINCTATRYEREWNGSTLLASKVPSEKFADAVVGLSLDSFVGRRTEDQIDLQGIYDLQRDIEIYFGDARSVDFGFVFDSTQVSYEESLLLACNTAFVTPYQIASKMNFYFNGPQLSPSALLNHRNKYPNTDKRTRSFTTDKEHDAVEFVYRDQETEADETLIIPLASSPLNPKRIEVSGVTTSYLANIHANRTWNKLQYQRLSHECDAFSSARLLRPGQRISMVNNTEVATQDGEILASNGLRLTLSQGVVFEVSKTYSILLENRNGSVEGIPCTEGDNQFEIVLASPPSEVPYTGFEQARTRFEFAADGDENASQMLIEEANVRLEDGRETVHVVAINYDERYWQDDN